MVDEIKVRKTKESGDIYLSSTGVYYEAPEITPQKIIDLNDNIYARGLMTKQVNLLFSDKFTLEVTDSKGKQNEEAELDMMRMCDAPDVSLWAKIQMAWADEFKFGCSINNDVWDWDENVYTLKKLRHLPTQSFNTIPYNQEESVYCQLLPGITLGDDGELEFWQTTEESATPLKIENATMYKNPTSPELGGTSIFLPLIPIINMLSFTWKTQMQQVNRTGSKILFLKVTDPQPASELNGNVSDLEAAKLILKHWGKNTGFTLRGNMEIIDPQIKDDSNSLEIIEALNQMLIDYTTSIDLLSQGSDGTRLGGSDTQRMQMVLRHIKSVHSGLEEWASALLQKYLDANKYEDHTVKVIIPAPEVDTSEIDIKRAEVGISGEVLKVNEIRVLLGQEELSDEEIDELIEHYASKRPAAPSPLGLQVEEGEEGEEGEEEGEVEEVAGSAAKPTNGRAATKITSVGRGLADELIMALEHEE